MKSPAEAKELIAHWQQRLADEGSRFDLMPVPTADLTTILEYASLMLPKHPSMDGTRPVVLYLGSEGDVDELVEAFRAVYPSMQSVKVPA